MKQTKREKRIRRHTRIRARIQGTHDRPRISIFRSNRHVWVQAIDDVASKTMFMANDSEVRGKKSKSSPLMAAAEQVGALIAKKAQEHNIKKVVFDRGGYKYHGAIRALAEGMRKAGLQV